LWPNQFVKARLLVDVRRGALVIPAVAVQRGPRGTFVYVVQNDVAQARDVTVEATQGDEALIAKGLVAGDSIVVEGQNQLRPGAKVAARAAHP
jgi:multidrug efflux system membrane fusion protein